MTSLVGVVNDVTVETGLKLLTREDNEALLQPVVKLLFKVSLS